MLLVYFGVVVYVFIGMFISYNVFGWEYPDGEEVIGIIALTIFWLPYYFFKYAFKIIIGIIELIADFVTD